MSGRVGEHAAGFGGEEASFPGSGEGSAPEVSSSEAGTSGAWAQSRSPGDPETLIDRLLDGEASERERESLMHALREHPELGEELARLRGVLAGLRQESPQLPDLSAAILCEIGRRRGFVGRTFRRVGSTLRVAALIGLLVGVGVVAMLQSRSPQVVLRAAPTPVTHVVDAVRQEVGDVRAAVDRAELVVRREIASGAGEFAERLGVAPRLQVLSFGSGAELSVRVAVDAKGSTGAPSVVRASGVFEPVGGSWTGGAPISASWVGSTWEGGAVVVVDGRERVVRSTMAMHPRGFVVTPSVARRAQFELGQGAGLP